MESRLPSARAELHSVMGATTKIKVLICVIFKKEKKNYTSENYMKNVIKLCFYKQVLFPLADM